MNRRQFLSLLPAAAVVGTAAAAAPKSLSLEEGLLSAWRIGPSYVIVGKTYLKKAAAGAECRSLRLNNYLHKERYLLMNCSQDDLHDIATWFQIPSPVTEQDGWWLQTEQGPMRFCPHSLRWFPYSPKTDAI